MLIRLVISGQPVSGKNHKNAFIVRGKSGRMRAVVVNGKAIREWYAKKVPEIALQWRDYRHPTITGRAHITLHQYLQFDLDSERNPDGDNVQSAVWDALQKAGVVANDRQFCWWAGSTQQDAKNPRVIVEIRVVESADSPTMQQIPNARSA